MKASKDFFGVCGYMIVLLFYASLFFNGYGSKGIHKLFVCHFGVLLVAEQRMQETFEKVGSFLNWEFSWRKWSEKIMYKFSKEDMKHLEV